MKKMNTGNKCLASLAVFRELYDSNRDIYSIIGEILKEVITSNGKYQFTSSEITQLLNERYEFDILDAVVVTALRKFKKSYALKNGTYTILNKDVFATNLTEKHVQIQHDHEIIIDNLFSFIESKQKIPLTRTEKGKIASSFCSFLVDATKTCDYFEYISAFILQGKQNISFTNQLKTIREGVVLYTGLKYNPKLNELGNWKTELTIYLDTEILFYLAGYNGTLHQTLVNDFLNLINEINRTNIQKKGKRLIKLEYFVGVKNEIDGFFKRAEFIINGKDNLDPSKTAMTSIVNGCKTPSDIIEKKAHFYNLLKENSITEDGYKFYYSGENNKYNLYGQELSDKLSEKHGVSDISENLNFLNFINIHRKGISDNGFEQMGYILLTGTSITLAIAWDESLKEKGNVPLASNLDFLTNKFWFNLNKGFGTSDYPKTFDIITKAQIVLSSQLKNSVSDKFDELTKQSKEGKLTEEQALTIIAELRKEAMASESINDTDIDNVLKSIEETSIEIYLKEQEFLKYKAIKSEEENRKLKEILEQSVLEKQEAEKKHNEQLTQTEKKNKEQEDELNKYREAEKTKNEKKRKQKKMIRYFIFFCLIMAVGIYLCLYHNKTLGSIFGLIASSLTILSFLGYDAKKIINKIKNRN